jgi:predicted MPP superfamily phosphohydrolase
MNFIKFAIHNMPVRELIVVLAFLGAVAAVYIASAAILLRGAIRRWQGRPAPMRARWRRVCRGTLLSLAGVGVLCFAYAYFIEPYWPEVCRYTVATAKLPTGAQPIRIVHISDTHCDPTVRLEDRLPDIIADLKPDIILFTGDAINSVEGLPNFRRLMTRLAAVAPTYAVRGNWEWNSFRGIDLYAGTGATELIKKIQPVKIRDTTLYLVGVAWPDWDSAPALQDKLPPGALSVMMYHAPDLAVQIPIKTDLLLVGHTHGGQVALPFYGALVTLCRGGKRFERGMYDLGGPMMNVNRGIGMEGGHMPRVRFFSRPDVSLIELVPK